MRVVFGAITVLLLSVIAYFLFTGGVGNGVKKLPATLDQASDLMPIPNSPLAAPTPVPIPPTRAVVAPAPIPVPAVVAVPVVEAIGKRTHTVQAGESLWTISKTYYGSGDYHARIGEANRLKNNTIRAGQVLVIPAPPSGVAMREAVVVPTVEREVETSDENNSGAIAELVDVSTENEDSKSATSPSDQMAPSLSVKIPINK